MLIMLPVNVIFFQFQEAVSEGEKELGRTLRSSKKTLWPQAGKLGFLYSMGTCTCK